MNTTSVHYFRYPYEEFADHIKAMKTVRDWEETSRFGHVGSEQTDRAHIARVLEYFSDSYETQAEAVEKAERFLLICDYLGRHTELFTTKGMVELTEASRLLVEPQLLRAVHYLFTSVELPAKVDPKQVMVLAEVLKDMDRPVDASASESKQIKL